MDGKQTYEVCVWMDQDGRVQGSKTACDLATGECVTRNR